MIKLPLSFKYTINRLEKLQRYYQDALKNSENSINSLTNAKGLIQSYDKKYKSCINEAFNLACQICITIVMYILYCSDFQDIEFKYRECEQNLATAEDEYKSAIQKLNHDKEEVAKLYKAVQNQKTYIAKKVGVPACYIENVCIFRRELENKVDIYFGGRNNPAGYGHGYYIVRLSDGRVLYRSSPTTSINQ